MSRERPRRDGFTPHSDGEGAGRKGATTRRAAGKSAIRNPQSEIGFTLIELLVVIAIIAILAAILFPVFARAREKARQSTCLSNLKQLGQAVQMYAQDYEGYPIMSSPSSQVPRTRWADAIFAYVKSEKMFTCPNVTDANVLSKTFAHNAAARYGGYGFNYQYLGNSRSAPPNLPFSAADAMVERPADTVALADTDGALNANGTYSVEGVYVVDPPVGSSRGSGNASGYYAANTYANGGRAIPAERHTDMVNVAFCDGHAKAIKRSQLDDFDRDGSRDNGYWNGYANPSWW